MSLPSGEQLTTDDASLPLERVDEPGAILHHVDRTIVQAGLLDQLANRAQADQLLASDHPRRYLLTSDEPAKTAFTVDYEVLDTHHWNLMGLREKCKRLDVGHVTLRASIDPERYWDVRNAIEEGLEGPRHVHLFRVDERGVIAEALADDDQQAEGS